MSDHAMIERIAKRFEVEHAENPHLYHPDDVGRLTGNEIGRFLAEHNQDEMRTFDAVVAAFRWRHELGVHQLRDEDFFRELWLILEIEQRGFDREGHPVSWMRMRHFPLTREVLPVVKRFFCYFCDRVNQQLNGADNRQVISVVDMSDASTMPSMIQLDLVRFLVQMSHHYPGMARRVYIVNQPSFIRALSNGIIKLLRPNLRNLLMFITSEKLTEFIEPEQFPVYLAESRRRELFRPPSASPSLTAANFEQYGFTRKTFDEFWKNYEKIVAKPMAKLLERKNLVY